MDIIVVGKTKNPIRAMTMRRDYLVFGQPLIGEAEIEEVVKSLRTGWLGTGPKVAAFEKLIADYKKVAHAVAVNSCTAGLHLGCLALELQPGDEVIIPAMTFCATVNAVIHAGATPVLVDVEPDSFNIDVAKLEAKITPHTRAVMPVHFAGRPCNMGSLMQVAEKHGLRVIEDCAHGIETEYRGQKAGTFGACGVLSFYSTKNIVTGEGGMVLTNDEKLASRIKRLALHGMSQDAWKRFSDAGYKHYEVVEIGFKYNMMDLQAAIGLHQIGHVDEYLTKRERVWSDYDEAFEGLPAQRPSAPEPDSRHARHLYTLLINDDAPITRDQFIAELHKRNIGTGVHYRAIPVHPIYQQRFGWSPLDYPIAQSIGDRTVSLPLSAKLTEDDVGDVISAVVELLQR